MATVAPPADQATDLLQKLSLDSPAKASEIPEPNKKTAVYQYGGVDVHGQVPSYDRSLTPMLPSDAADPSVCYVPNPYNPYQYYNVYGSGQEWTDYPAYTNPEGVDMNSGIYGENGTVVYPQGYGYAAYPYSPATSPAPQLGGEGQLYGAQQYQYPNYFPNSGPYASSVATPTQPDLSANKPAGVKTLPADSNNVASAAGITKGSNGSAPVKPTNQATLNTSSNLYGMGAPGGGLAAGYQDPRYAYEGYYAPVPWHDGSKYSDVQRPVSGSGVASSYSKSSTVPSSRNQNYRSNSHYTSVHQPSSVTGYGTAQGYYNRMYQNKLYGQYGSTGRSALGYGSSGYDSRTNGRGWAATDNKYRSWGRGNSYYYGNENNVDGLNELNRGPRAKGTKNQKGNLDDSLEVKEQTGESNVTEVGEADNTCVVPDREQYNKEDFPVDYANAMFFIIKSYSEDDVHKSIKYNVCNNTPLEYESVDKADPSNTNIYIGNISPETTEASLSAHFSAYGPVAEVKLHKKGGYGFVKFEQHKSAVKAIVGQHGKELDARVLKCSWGKNITSTARTPNSSASTALSLAAALQSTHLGNGGSQPSQLGSNAQSMMASLAAAAAANAVAAVTAAGSQQNGGYGQDGQHLGQGYGPAGHLPYGHGGYLGLAQAPRQLPHGHQQAPSSMLTGGHNMLGMYGSSGMTNQVTPSHMALATQMMMMQGLQGPQDAFSLQAAMAAFNPAAMAALNQTAITAGNMSLDPMNSVFPGAAYGGLYGFDTGAIQQEM